MTIRKRPVWVWVTAIIAVVFGVMTIKSGGSALFINGEARLAAGNYIDFILWFNFFAGFFYIAAGIGIWLKKTWAPTVAITIAVLTLLVFGAFGVHILNGGEYEQRTVIGMSLRTLVWAAIATASWSLLLGRAVKTLHI
jgi:hypothetical protein